MTCFSTISINGYPLSVMRYTYAVWEQFGQSDRLIRCTRRDMRTSHLQGVPRFEPEAQKLQLDFVYSVSADVLRRRLGRAGFTVTTLEQEFQRYYETFCANTGNKVFTPSPEKAAAQAYAFRAATFNDWLAALEETVRAGVTRIRRSCREVAEPTNILVDIITGSNQPIIHELMPKHSLDGFPCISLDNMAVALLEVTPGNAVCEQEVTDFIAYQGDTTFDDMRLRKVRCHDECDI
jgi:hypothetical protein